MKKPTQKEAKAIEKLRGALTSLPDTLWIYVGDGTLHVMAKHDNGERAVTGTGGVDQDYIVATISGVCADGGGW